MINFAKKLEIPLDKGGHSGHVYVNLEDVPLKGIVLLKAKVPSREPYVLYDSLARSVGRDLHDTNETAWEEIEAICTRVTAPKYKLRKSMAFFAVSRGGPFGLRLHGVAHIQKISSKKSKVHFLWRNDDIYP